MPSPPTRRSPLRLALALALAFTAAPAAEPLRVEISRDTWVSSYPTEVEGSNGASPKMKFKGVQELALMDIDASALKGRRVVKAQLHLHGEGVEALQRMTVSTIAEEWTEGTGTGYQKIPGASSFTWARTGEQRWGGDQPDITAVINGSGGSLWGFADPTPRDASGWQIIPVDPAVVQARIEGRSFGFAVMDDVGSEYLREGNKFTYRPFLNRYVSSKDDKKSTRPYFTLWLEDGPPAATLPQYTKPFAAKPATLPPATLPPATLPPATLPPATLPPATLPPATLPPAVPLPATATVRLPVDCRDEFGEPLHALEFFAARGETIHFTVATGASLTLPQVKVQTYAMPQVAQHYDPLVPGPSTGPTCIEIHVPKDARPGRITGQLTVGTQSLPCTLTVWDFTLPDRLSFIPQMNAYSLPGNERAFYRLAHEHRTTLNVLPYHWTGKIDAGPVIKPDGQWDWTAWDAAYGPLFDGSAFTGLPRSGVPIEAFYLMLNENWPMNQEPHFKGGYWIETAYDEAYWQQFREAAGRIARHLRDKGWTEPMFEFYLNNKVSFKTPRWDRCSAPWIFDEPSNTQDFWALRRFGLEFWKGAGAQPGLHLAHRADISRPQWQRDLLDGVVNAEIVSGALRTYGASVRERARRFGNLVYMYGTSNALGSPSVSNAAWCVEAWALGADGVVPWQTIGKADALQKPDDLALFYPTPTGPLPSLRLKTFRAGQQLVEYLTLYTALSGESREGVAAALLAEPGMRAVTVKKNEDDAGKAAFPPETHASLTTLRHRLGHWLHAKAPAPRDRWHDPRPKPHAPEAVKVIEVVK